VTEFENIILLERFACSKEIKSSKINYDKFSEN